MIDPCSISEIKIDSAIIDKSIKYNIHQTNTIYEKVLDTSLVTLTFDTLLCPVEVDVMSADGRELNNSIFAYDSATHIFLIDTQDTSFAGVYKLKVVASF